MRIIGGHDYYDGAGLGMDAEIIFVRQEVVTEDHPFTLPSPVAHAPLYRNRPGAREVILSFHIVLLGGQAYPAAQESWAWARSGKRGPDGREIILPAKTDWHFDRDQAMAALQRIEEHSDDSWTVKRRHARRVERLSAHFAQAQSATWTDWMISARAVTGLISPKDPRQPRKGVQARINIADLGEIGFYRRVDPATAHMEIARFIGGVLPHGPETVEITDKDRLRKAGFDARTSFRMDPGVKKPRRRARG